MQSNGMEWNRTQCNRIENAAHRSRNLAALCVRTNERTYERTVRFRCAHTALLTSRLVVCLLGVFRMFAGAPERRESDGRESSFTTRDRRFIESSPRSCVRVAISQGKRIDLFGPAVVWNWTALRVRVVHSTRLDSSCGVFVP